ncbi:MAG: hypothetical protein COA71_14650 [SAR86 cluster bacterium]|uniref:DUF5983 domain-containing protein n=1 Tax=SAR86 cluster bacterium TaxID=2030880 RepID=A0A2A5C590_9GAMM|nr:MAG: hypothetical protein COA71_14650 [SAR86 cluster bacterium]
MNLEINKELVLSTAHISHETSLLLANEDWLDNLVISIYAFEYGWRIYAPYQHNTLRNELPNELNKLLELAMEHDCKWLVLDQDGAIHNEFPTFDW